MSVLDKVGLMAGAHSAAAELLRSIVADVGNADHAFAERFGPGGMPSTSDLAQLRTAIEAHWAQARMAASLLREHACVPTPCSLRSSSTRLNALRQAIADDLLVQASQRAASAIELVDRLSIMLAHASSFATLARADNTSQGARMPSQS